MESGAAQIFMMKETRTKGIDMAIPDKDVAGHYDKMARHYDFAAILLYLVGFRERAYRRLAVEALNLNRGDTVVEIGCGTGLNLSLLQKAVGPEGKIIGVDVSTSMLAQAGKRVKENGWSNVTLVQSDAAAFQFPAGIDGVISTYALTLIPGFERVIQNASLALASGKRLALADFKLPEKWPTWLVNLMARFLVTPFGGALEMAERHPWESIGKDLNKISFTEHYFGGIFLAVGEKR
jgi:ubiquinone/menaquinone biosynthesis C-methylase UbiE